MAAPRAREGKRQDPEAEGSEFVEEDLFNQYRPVRGRNNKGLADGATASAPCVTGFVSCRNFPSQSDIFIEILRREEGKDAAHFWG